jgi:hypothetical protein
MLWAGFGAFWRLKGAVYPRFCGGWDDAAMPAAEFTLDKIALSMILIQLMRKT